MALTLKDRVKETTTTTGTGTVTLAGAATGYQSFSAVGNANTTYYCIAGQTSAEWEVGIGTYTSSGTTLSRDTVLSSSNAGSLVSFSAGTKDVFVTYPSDKGVWLDAAGDAIFAGVVQVAAGTALLPALIPSGDPNTGVWFPAADTIAASTGGSERMRIDSSGNVGIGTSSPSSALNIAKTGANAQILVSTTTSGNPSIYLDASGVNNGQLFVDRTDAGITKLQAGGSLVFQTNGATERLRIDTSGNVLVTNPAGLGYGTGSGGTVTQATSKSTSVTLNKPTGQITMNNAALGAGASVGFTVNNTIMASVDTVVITIVGGGSVTDYTFRAQSGAGAFIVYVTNNSAGSLSEALVFNFAIIKGATS